jgi:hypothetical protein
MRYSTGICLFFFIAISNLSKAQSLSPDSALAMFKDLYPQEKVFVQTDKEFYITGETIWMKAWCVLEEAPSFLSKIIYIDLVNNNGQVVLKKMYLLYSLSSTGADFELPESLTTGTYCINAYTLWMLNFPDYIFRKNVFIYGGDYRKSESKKNSGPVLNIRFFPEGGDIIAGVNNRIAFKATEANGFPYMVKGQITDKNGKKVSDIISEHDGMGSVEFLFD